MSRLVEGDEYAWGALDSRLRPSKQSSFWGKFEWRRQQAWQLEWSYEVLGVRKLKKEAGYTVPTTLRITQLRRSTCLRTVSIVSVRISAVWRYVRSSLVLPHCLTTWMLEMTVMWRLDWVWITCVLLKVVTMNGSTVAERRQLWKRQRQL